MDFKESDKVYVCTKCKQASQASQASPPGLHLMFPILDLATPHLSYCSSLPWLQSLNLHFHQPQHPNGSNPYTSPGGSPTIYPPSPLQQRKYASLYRQPHHKCHLKRANLRLCRAARAAGGPSITVTRHSSRVQGLSKASRDLRVGHMARISK